MPALIATSAVRTCLGDGAATFRALMDGVSGVGPLRDGDPERLDVVAGYHVEADDRAFLASRMLTACVRDAVVQAGLGTRSTPVPVLVGTGLRELAAVERGRPFPLRHLHFGAAVQAAAPGLDDVVTLAGACSAGGHALALAQDLVELGDADAVVVAATDAMTTSMLAMIGRVAAEPTDCVRPFDRDRTGVLLGDGAAAVVVVPESWPGPVLGRLLATGLSCDAWHETAPDVAGIGRAMHDAYARAGLAPETVDVVVAHGTGTALNDPAECAALRTLSADPLVTAVKGAVGHTSGSAALINLDVALRCLAEQAVPPVVGLRTVLDEGSGMRFAQGGPVPVPAGLVQVDAFGFGGVNAVSLVAVP